MGFAVEVMRLAPEMASRKLQVLDFIRQFYAHHGIGPSLSEIAAAIGTNRSRVQDAIRKLAHEGRVHRVAGKARGVRPADTREMALRLLEEEGWLVNGGRLELVPPPPPLIDLDEHGRLTVTKASLPGTRARAQCAHHDGPGPTDGAS